MKGNMKAWIVVGVTYWLWWAAIAAPPPSSTLEDNEHTKLGYQLVQFSAKDATKQNYVTFLEVLRGKLASGKKRYEIPLLRSSSEVLDSQRFLIVQLTNWGALSIKLALDVTNINVVAYQAGNSSYFFPDAPNSAFSNLFKNTAQRKLPFKSNYADIERAAGRSRAEIDLGILELEHSVTSLYMFSVVHPQLLARAILVVLQMVSDVARFRCIEQRVRSSITDEGHQDFRPDAGILSLENNWRTLSFAIQNSNQGVFPSSVELQRSDRSPLEMDSLTGYLTANLALMPFICNDVQGAALGRPLFIKPVVGLGTSNDICVTPEPTVRLTGRNGLCVDVTGGNYANGSPIKMWQCHPKNNVGVNQQWTLKRDGTIRSNGKCMINPSKNYGTDVVIFDCKAAANDATRWKILTDGSIVKPQTSLALSAEHAGSGMPVTVYSKHYKARQAWLATNNIEPFVTPIVGLRDLCLTASKDSIWVEKCVSNKAEQKWAFYPDSTIRPQQNRNNCLDAGDQTKGRTIRLASCSPGFDTQRWLFRNDGSIYHLNSGYVMDVPNSDPSSKQIIIWSPSGQPNQKWYPVL